MEEQANEVESIQESSIKTQDNLKWKQFISQHKILSSVIGCIIGFIFIVFLALIWGTEGSAEENIIGYTYSGGAVSDEIVMRSTIIFNEDYTFDMYIEAPYEEESYSVVGIYEIDGNNVTLIVKSGSNPVYTYDESNKSLTNGNIVLYQVSK